MWNVLGLCMCVCVYLSEWCFCWFNFAWVGKVLCVKPETFTSEWSYLLRFIHDLDVLIREPMPAASRCSQCWSLCNMHYNIGQVIDNTNKVDTYNGTIAEILLCKLHSTSKHAKQRENITNEINTELWNCMDKYSPLLNNLEHFDPNSFASPVLVRGIRLSKWWPTYESSINCMNMSSDNDMKRIFDSLTQK